jgi:alkaline phosphatase D
MPIREDVADLSAHIYRSFRFGNLVTLCMLDTRLIGRDAQVPVTDIAALESPTRSVMGATQESWLADELALSVRNNATWNVLGQQILFGAQVPRHTRAINADTWDGYRANRDRVFDIIERYKVPNITVLTGDIHSSWAQDLPRDPWNGYDKSKGIGSLGVEFAGTAVTSPSPFKTPEEAARNMAAARERPHLHYIEDRYRGYFVVDMTRQRLQADFFGVETIVERSTKERFEKGFITESGSNHLVEVSKPAL